MVSLWDLLTGVCLAASVGCAIASAKIAGVGISGYALAIVVGLALGVLFAWTLRVVAKATLARLQRRPNSVQSASLQKWFFPGLYLAATLWILFAGLLGGQVSLAVLRLVF